MTKTKKTEIKVTKTMNEQEIYERLSMIPSLNEKVDTLILLIKGDPDNKQLGLCDHVKATNGKVKNIKWIATTALTMTMVLLGFLFQHISK